MNDIPTIVLLKRCPLFADFSDEALEALPSYFSRMRGSNGDRLYTQVDERAGLYVIASGTCLATLRAPDGAERRVAKLTAPDSFGELSLLLRGERLLSVEAAGDVELLELDIDAFRRLKRTNPDLCLMLIMAIVRRFGRVVDECRELFQRLLLRHFAGLEDT